MASTISVGNTPITSSGNGSPFDPARGGACAICGEASALCAGLGVVSYDVPVGDPRFGKLYRCPNNPVDQDEDRQERLRRLSNLDAYTDKTFNNFYIDSPMHDSSEQGSLTMAYNRARSFADSPQGWLLMEGTYGCGKTHLAAAIGNVRIEHGDRVLFITSPDLLDHLRATYAPESESTYDATFDRLRNADLLILDDLGVENPSQWAQEKLFQLLNHRYSHRLPTVITTNADIDRLDARIRSRLLDIEKTSRMVITAPDYRSLQINQREQLASTLPLYHDMTFETFDVSTNATVQERENLMSVAQAAFAYAKSGHEGWLALIGPYGTGKTHLAAAVANYRRERGEDVFFISVPDLMDYLKDTFGGDSGVTLDQRFQKVRNVPFLVLDDIGSGMSSQWTREKLFQLIDHRYVTRKPTVLTTAKHIENLDERLQTRLLDDRMCVIYALTTRSFVMRRRGATS